MVSVRFDTLIRSITPARSRRGVLVTVVGGALGLLGQLETRGKRKKHKKHKQPKTAVCPSGQKSSDGGCISDSQCSADSECPNAVLPR